jgi:transposase
LLYADYKYTAFDSDDVVNFLLRMRELHKPDDKIAVFLDNASIHKSKATQARAADPDINIKLIYNIPYRPDLNGIEFFWGYAKRAYRKHLMQYKAEGIRFDNFGLA